MQKSTTTTLNRISYFTAKTCLFFYSILFFELAAAQTGRAEVNSPKEQGMIASNLKQVQDDNKLHDRLEALDRLSVRVQKLLDKGELDQAILLAEVVLATKQKLLGKKNLEISEEMRTLAKLYQKKGIPKKALLFLKAAMEIKKELLGNFHPEVLRCQVRLAEHHQNMAQYNEAISHFKSILQTLKSKSENETSQKADILEKLASVYLNMNHGENAVPLLQESLAIRRASLDKNHPHIAKSLTQLALAYYSMGNFLEARKNHQSALFIRENHYGQKHPRVADSKFHLANAYRLEKDLVQAMLFAEESLDIRKKVYGGSHIKVADSLGLVGDIYRQRDELGKALPFLKTAVKLRKKALDANHPDLAVSQNLLAKLYVAMGESEKALSFLNASLTIRKEVFGKEAPIVLKTLDEVVQVYCSIGAYKKALPYCKEAFAIVRKKSMKSPQQFIQRLENLANIYASMEDYENALPLYETSLSYYKENNGEDSPEIAAKIDKLAQLYSKSGFQRKAAQLFENSLEMRKNLFGRNHPDVAENMSKLANTYESVGNYHETIHLLKAVLNINRQFLNETHPDLLKTTKRLASAYESNGEPKKALLHYQNVLQIQKKIHGNDHENMADTLTHIASLYKDTGKIENALSLYESALSIRKKLLAKDHPEVAKSMNNLANLLQAIGKPFKARSLYESALKIFDKHLGKYHPDLTTIQNNLAILLASLGDFIGAHRLLQSSIRIENDIRNHLYPALTGPQKLAFITGMNATLDLYLSLISTTSVAVRGDNLSRILEYVWTRKKYSAMFALTRLHNERSPQEAKLRDLVEKLHAAQRKLAKHLWPLKLDKAHKKRLENGQGLREQIQKFEIELTRQSAYYARKRKERNPLVKDVLSKLPHHAALIEFIPIQWWDFSEGKFSGRHYLAITLTHTKGVVLYDLGNAQRIDEVMAEFHEALSSASNASFTRSRSSPISFKELFPKVKSEQLYRLLLQPLQLHMQGISKTYLSPAEGLNLIPFEILLAGNGRFLSDFIHVCYLRCGSDILSIIPPPARSSPAIFADPDYERVQESFEPAVIQNDRLSVSDQQPFSFQFTPLQKGKNEAFQIEDILQASSQLEPKLFIQKMATEKNIKELDSPRFLHLATHGFFLTESTSTVESQKPPGTFEVGSDIDLTRNWRTGISLAGANSGNQLTSILNSIDDGILQPFEIASLKLQGTEIVSFSSTLINTPDRDTGQAIYAIRRAVQLAGAPFLLHPLWQIPEEPRKFLMSKFYQNYYQKKFSAYKSLWEAKTALRKYFPLGYESKREKLKRNGTANGPYDHPYYWGAFVLVQDGP